MQPDHIRRNDPLVAAAQPPVIPILLMHAGISNGICTVGSDRRIKSEIETVFTAF